MADKSFVPYRFISLQLIEYQLVWSAGEQRVCAPGPPRRRRRGFHFSGVCSLSRIFFPIFAPVFFFFGSIRSVNMGKKEEDEIIRIAKKMDKMAQKKNGVRCLMRVNAYLPAA